VHERNRLNMLTPSILTCGFPHSSQVRGKLRELQERRFFLRIGHFSALRSGAGAEPTHRRATPAHRFEETVEAAPEVA
jgi:hypothetical protein